MDSTQQLTDSRPVVLVLNTNVDTVEMLRAELDGAGFLSITSMVDELVRGITTMDPLLLAHPPSAVIYDVALPYDRQWALMMHLQENPLLKDVPFVLTTTNVSRLHQVVEEANGEVHEIVGKPYDLGLVVDAVRRAIDSRPTGPSANPS